MKKLKTFQEILFELTQKRTYDFCKECKKEKSNEKTN